MSFADALTTIESRFHSLWDKTDADVTYGNVAFQPRNNFPWVRLTVQHGDTNRAAVYPEYYRSTGVIFAQIFVPPNKGTKLALTLADTVSGIWRGQQFSGVSCLAPSVTDVGVRDGWYQVNVSCPYYRDELLPAI